MSFQSVTISIPIKNFYLENTPSPHTFIHESSYLYSSVCIAEITLQSPSPFPFGAYVIRGIWHSGGSHTSNADAGGWLEMDSICNPKQSFQQSFPVISIHRSHSVCTWWISIGFFLVLIESTLTSWLLKNFQFSILVFMYDWMQFIVYECIVDVVVVVVGCV